jgi:hypothetical protein
VSSHLITIVALLLGLACCVAGLTGAGLALFFVGAAAEIAVWLRVVQSPRRVSPRMLAKLQARR